MAPDKHGKWTPRGTTKHFPRRTSPPKVTHYTPPQTLPPPVAPRTPTALDADSKNELMAFVSDWLSEAARLEAEMKDETLEERLAQLMFEVDVPLLIKEQEALWDPNGGGTVSKGEFRLHIAAVGIEDAGVEEVDAIFDRWDVDRSGQLDMDELGAALRQLRTDFVKKHGPPPAAHSPLTQRVHSACIRRQR